MMVRSSKIRKCGKVSKLSDLEGKDWISSLPDAILCHILSLMPTKHAVQTSLLSTRWRYLWTSVPTLDFDNYYSVSESSGFMDFVDRVLILHNLPYINKFHLGCRFGKYNPYRVNSWICAAIKFNVRELVLNLLHTELVVELPRSLFTSVNLGVLKLSGDVHFGFPMLVFLPSLKVLHLSALTFLDDDSFKNLLSGCPVLEELDIERSQQDNIKTLCICSSTLKKLRIRNTYLVTSFQCGFVIKAPALEILDLCDFVSRVFDVGELPFLVKANFRILFRHDYYEGTEDYCNGVVRMLGKTSAVQHLRLRAGTLKVFNHASARNLMLFHALTHLHVGVYDIQWSVLLDLLRNIPSLKVLLCEEDYMRCQGCLWCGEPENVPKCLSLSLETIEFNGFSGCKAEMKFVRYLVENAMVLKKLTLHSWSRNKKIKTSLLKCTRGSSTCQIELRYKKSSRYPSKVEWL